MYKISPVEITVFIYTAICMSVCLESKVPNVPTSPVK